MKNTPITQIVIFLLWMTVINLYSIESEPVFYATFDHDFRASFLQQSISGKHSYELTMETLSMLLQNGIKGKAAKIGAEEINGKFNCSNVQYPGNILSVESGTIAFWMKPLDWNFFDAKFHVFCEARGPNSWLLVYKYNNAREIYFLFGTPGKGGKGVSYVIAAAPASKLEKNIFHHITATWTRKDIRLYINGVLQSVVEIPPSIMPQSFKTMTIGPNSFWKNQHGYFLIDDFKIYKQALSESEIEKLFISYGVKKIDKSNIPVKISKLNMINSPDRKFLNLNFFLTRTASTGKGFPVEMEIKKNKQSVIKKTLTSSSSEYYHKFDLKNLSQGEYLLILKPVRETASDKIENRTFLFTVGKTEVITDHSVPSPWSPVNFENGIMSAKMQKVDFSKGLLPTQLYSENISLLRSPMRFICNSNYISGNASIKTIEKHPDFQILESNIVDKDFALTSRCRFEFDGMMWFQITLTPKKAIQIKNAKIEIPLKAEVSTLYNSFTKQYFSFSGFYAGELNKNIKCNHYLPKSFPGIWVGNEERGLYYFSQDQAGRRLKKREETVCLSPGKNGAVFTINLIDYLSEISKPVTWSFGLQVTPVRPFVRNRIYWRPEHNINLWFAWANIHNVPDARFKKNNYDKLRSLLSRNGKIPVFHYFTGFSASPENPGFPVNAHEWSITPPAIGTEVEPNSHEWKYVFVCANSKNYRDTYLHNLEKCIRELKMDNLYFDNCWSFYCGNKNHGCGWYDDKGQFYPTFNVLGSRELAKGCYRTLQKIYPNGKIARHISQTPEVPLVAFSDCLADGECFMMDVGRDESYYNLFTPDFFRASFMGRPLGIPSVFIAQFNRAYQLHFPEKLKAAKAGMLQDQELKLRHFSGYALVHDTGVWPNFGADIKKFWDILDHAGVQSNSVFYGYWNSDNPVKKISPMNKLVMVSSYICNNGAIVVLMNDSNTSATVKLALDTKIFGDSPVILDVENNMKADLQSIILPARNFRMLKIMKK